MVRLELQRPVRGHKKQTSKGALLSSALTPKAGIRRQDGDVRFVPFSKPVASAINVGPKSKAIDVARRHQTTR